MRILLITFLIFQCDVFSQAVAQPTSLKQIMKSIDDELSIVSNQLDKRDANGDSANRSLQIRKLFTLAFNFEPPKVQEMPETERPALLRAYDRFLGSVVVVTADLEDSFLQNKNDQADLLVKELNRIRREAHKLLK